MCWCFSYARMNVCTRVCTRDIVMVWKCVSSATLSINFFSPPTRTSIPFPFLSPFLSPLLFPFLIISSFPFPSTLYPSLSLSSPSDEIEGLRNHLGVTDENRTPLGGESLRQFYRSQALIFSVTFTWNIFLFSFFFFLFSVSFVLITRILCGTYLEHFLIERCSTSSIFVCLSLRFVLGTSVPYSWLIQIIY